MKCPAEIYSASLATLLRPARPHISAARPRRPRHRLRPHLHASQKYQHLDRPRRSAPRHQGGRRRHLDRQLHALRSRLHRSRSRKPCNPSTTPSAQGCHPCLRYVPLPMSPGRTIDETWRRAKGFRTLDGSRHSKVGISGPRHQRRRAKLSFAVRSGAAMYWHSFRSCHLESLVLKPAPRRIIGRANYKRSGIPCD